MTQYVINIGAIPNDGTGDPLRTAFNETNLNFDQVFAAGPVLSNIQIANNKILTTNTNGNLVLAPNGTGVVQSNVSIVPNLANLRNLGSSTQRWATVYTQYLNATQINLTGDLTVAGNLTVQGNIIQIGNIVTDSLTIQLANTASNVSSANGAGITVGVNDNIATILYNSTSNVWTTNIGISSVGNITAPYFVGNGSQLTGLAATYGNANVVTLLAGFGSNTVSTTGNISGGYIFGNGSQFGQWIFSQANLTVPANGNISTSPGSNGNINFKPDGSGTVNITGASPILLHLVGDEPNALNRIEIDTYGNNSGLGGTFTGVFYRGTPDAPEVVQSGDRLASLKGKGYNGSVVTNPSGQITIDAQGAWSNAINGTHISFWTTPANSNVIQESARIYAVGDYHQIIGNIVVDNGSVTADYFFGDGSQLSNVAADTGNVTFSDQIVIGTGDQYGYSGLFLAPGPNSVGNLQYLQVRGGDYPTHIHFDTGNNAYYDQYFGNDNKFVKLEAGAAGNIVIGTDDNVGNLYNWTFDNTGNLNTPQGGWIGAAGVKGDGTMLTGGTGQIASLTSFYADAPGIYAGCFTANPDGTVNITTYGNGTGLAGQWVFSGADLTAPGDITADRFLGNVAVLAGLNARGEHSANLGSAGFTELDSNVILQITGNANSYTQINFQNINSGDRATTDYIATAAFGTDSTFFVDMGIASNSYDQNNPNNSLGNSLYPQDSYLYSMGGNSLGGSGGNLVVGSNEPGGVVRIIADGSDIGNIVATFSNVGISAVGNITGGNAIITGNTVSTSRTTGALTVAGGLGVAGTAYTNRSVVQGAYGNIILNEFTGIYNQKDSGTSLIQTTTNALSAGLGIQVTGAAGNGSQIYSTGTIDIKVGVTVQAEDTPSGGTVIASVASTGVTVTGVVSATGNITGGNVQANSRVITTPVVLANLTAVAGARAFVSDGNLVASGNFGAQIGSGGSNTVPVWSDGTNWYIG